MLHQSSLLSSNTAGSDWPGFSSCCSLHPSALMFGCVSVSTSLYVGVVEAEESVQAHVSSASSCVPLLHSEQTPLVGFAGALQIVPRCFPGCLWIWGTLRRKPRFLFSPFWTILMNNCDLTRKCKQVDRSESGQENIYCCQWNVKNAVLMEQARWCQPLHLSHE